MREDNLRSFLRSLQKGPSFFENVAVKKQPVGRSMKVFAADNKFRVACFDLVNYSKFDKFVLILIIISSVLLAMESPLKDPDSSFVATLFYADIVMSIAFAIEALLKLISYGVLFNGEESYLKSMYNCLDFFIVCISILSLSLSGANLGFFKILRLLRILRPLRVISRNEGLKIALSALFMALPNIANVSIVSGLFFLIFGIIGVFYFNGLYFTCNYALAGTLDHKWDCLNLGGEWQEFHFHFNDIQDSIVSLFHIATTAGWAENMYRGLYAYEIDYVGKRGARTEWIFFFVLFIILGSFFIQNLFVGIVISTFNREKERLGKSFLMTDK